jgi:hypothetical protein
MHILCSREQCFSISSCVAGKASVASLSIGFSESSTLPLPSSADHPRLPTLQALPATVSLPLPLLPLALPRQVPSSQVILQLPESPATPTQGPELGIDKYPVALLVDYQQFRYIPESRSYPEEPKRVAPVQHRLTSLADLSARLRFLCTKLKKSRLLIHFRCQFPASF